MAATGRDYLELIVCMDTEVVNMEKNYEGFGVEKKKSADDVPKEDNPFSNEVEIVGRHLLIKCATPTPREREWTWWAHTGGGKALAFKQPTMRPVVP